MRCKTPEPCSAHDRAHSHRLFYERTLAITSGVLGCDHFPLFLQLPACPAVAEVRSLSQSGYGYNYMGQTETPRREEWSVSSFSRCCRATSLCQHVKGRPSRSHGSITLSTIFSDGVRRLIIGTIVISIGAGRTALTFRGDPRRVRKKLSPCRLIGVRGRTNRRRIHGSTSEQRNGLCAVVPVSHAYLGATASDLGSSVESVRRCQDGKAQLEHRHGWHGTFVLWFSYRTSTCSHTCC